MTKGCILNGMHGLWLVFLYITCRVNNLLCIENGEPLLPENYDLNNGTTKIPDVDPCKPQHVHISFGDNVNEINIVWATKEYCHGLVKYGTRPWSYDNTAYASNTFFTDLNSHGLQHLYRAQLKGLHPRTFYFYEPMNSYISAGPFYFETPPQGNEWSPEFLMFGDLGIHTNTIPFLISEALSGNYTALIHIGDMAYDLKSLNGLVGDYFLTEIQSMAAYIPYLTCPGNHEIDFDNFFHYRNRFSMPQSDWPIPLSQMWYSIDIGPIHFISYSSEVFFTNNGNFIETQNTWLIRDLRAATANRKKTPWIIAFGHRPMYCTTQINDDCSLPFSRVRNGLENLFMKFGVDLVIQAHEHNYERLWPLYNWNVTDYSYTNLTVPVQIITGAAGSVEGSDMFKPDIQPNWSAFRLDTDAYGSYGRLVVANFTHIFWEQRSITNHSTLDSIWITKANTLSQRNNLAVKTVTTKSNSSRSSAEQNNTISNISTVFDETNSRFTNNSFFNVETYTSAENYIYFISAVIGFFFTLLFLIVLSLVLYKNLCQKKDLKLISYKVVSQCPDDDDEDL